MSCHGSRTVQKRVLFPETLQGKAYSLDQIPEKAVNEDPMMNQQKIELLWKNEKIEQLASGDPTPLGSLSEAIALLEFSEISDRGISSSSICLKDIDINEGSEEFPIRLKPDITGQSRRNALYQFFTETITRGKAEREIYATQRRKTNYDDFQKKIVRTNVISGYTNGPYMSNGNCWHKKSSPEGRVFLRRYEIWNDIMKSNDFANKGMENTIQEYKKVSEVLECDSPLFENTVLEYDSSTETNSCEQDGTEDMYKTSRPSEENSKYLKNKFSAGLSSSSPVYPAGKILSQQNFSSAQLFHQTVLCFLNQRETRFMNLNRPNNPGHYIN